MTVVDEPLIALLERTMLNYPEAVAPLSCAQLRTLCLATADVVLKAIASDPTVVKACEGSSYV